MRLTIEEIRESYNRHMKTHYKDGYITIFVDAYDCFKDTIEAQQQEIERLKDDLSVVSHNELCKAYAGLGITVNNLTKENKRLKQWLNDLQSGMYINCVYCGHRYGPESETPASMADVLKKHIEQCPEHPMSKLKQDNETLQAQVGRLSEILKPYKWDFNDGTYAMICPICKALIDKEGNGHSSKCKAHEAQADISSGCHNPADDEAIEHLNKQIAASELMMKEYCRNIADYLVTLAAAREALRIAREDRYFNKVDDRTCEAVDEAIEAIDKAIGGDKSGI